jgi:predicted dehydrogenase
MKSKLFVILLTVITSQFSWTKDKMDVAIIGLTHAHVHNILNKNNSKDINIIAIVEPNKDLAQRLTKMYKLPMNMVFPNIEEMLKHKKPTAVTAFNSIYEHLEVVEKCAPKGIHIMVEKPLAVNMKHAKKMEKLANKNNIVLFTNYETTWYPSNHKAKQILDNGELGELRKLVIHDGHSGPKEIGCNQEFLDWLCDPILNGGGAIVDFGCYGANLSTWLMNGEKPVSVIAITQQIKPDVYPKVDDEATIILEYPKAQSIIQASWNWPISRKDMEVYGKTGYLIAKNSKEIDFRKNEKSKIQLLELKPRNYPYNNPFSYFKSIIEGKHKLKDTDLSSLKNNMIVVEILDAGRESAKTGKRIYLRKP